MRILLPILLAAVLSIPPASAEILHGRVVSVADGDTVTVLDGENRQWKIRVAGIDAPEKKVHKKAYGAPIEAQPFGNASERSLSGMVAGKPVTVEWDKRDRYGRVVGKVLVSGRDAGLAQVEAGMAWWYRKYSHEQSLDDRIAYSAAEDAARSARKGLWRDEDPAPPWEFRKAAKRPTDRSR